MAAPLLTETRDSGPKTRLLPFLDQTVVGGETMEKG